MLVTVDKDHHMIGDTVLVTASKYNPGIHNYVDDTALVQPRKIKPVSATVVEH